MNEPTQLNVADTLVSRISHSLPGTYYGIVGRELAHHTSVLDIACGAGIPMRTLNRTKQFRVTGVDMFDAYLATAKQSGFYDQVVNADIRHLPFPNKSFDVVMALQIIEHLEKHEGLAFVRELERVARDKVIIATPVGFVKQEGYDHNDLQEHKSGWEPDEMRSMGYRVIGQSWKVFHGNRWPAKLTQLWRPLGLLRDFTSFLVQPIIGRHPTWCFQMVCVKDIAP